MVHMYNGILLSHKEEQNWVICRDLDGPMDLESVLQSEVSQKEKNNYDTSVHIYGIKKNGTDKQICRAVKDAGRASEQRQWSCHFGY